jgi:hypothetical protein
VLKINSRPNGWAHGSGGPGGPPGRQPGHPRAELRFARGARHYTGKLSSRSRAGRLLERGSASLEGRTPPRVRFHLARGPVTPRGRGSISLMGWIPPRVRFRLARGPCGLAASVPTPPTGAFNALTFAGAQVKDESTPLTCLGITPGAVPPTPPVRPPRHCAAWPASVP